MSVTRLSPGSDLFEKITDQLYELFFHSFYRSKPEFIDWLGSNLVFDKQATYSWFGTRHVVVKMIVPWGQSQIKEVRGKHEKWYIDKSLSSNKKKEVSQPTHLEFVLQLAD